MIRCCRFARLAVAGKGEVVLLVVVEVAVVAVMVEAIVSLRSTSGYVLTVSKLQSDSESDPETDVDALMIIDEWCR